MQSRMSALPSVIVVFLPGHVRQEVEPSCELYVAIGHNAQGIWPVTLNDPGLQISGTKRITD